MVIGGCSTYPLDMKETQWDDVSTFEDIKYTDNEKKCKLIIIS